MSKRIMNPENPFGLSVVDTIQIVDKMPQGRWEIPPRHLLPDTILHTDDSSIDAYITPWVALLTNGLRGTLLSQESALERRITADSLPIHAYLQLVQIPYWKDKDLTTQIVSAQKAFVALMSDDIRYQLDLQSIVVPNTDDVFNAKIVIDYFGRTIAGMTLSEFAQS